MLEDFIGNNDLSLLNDKFPTYLHPAYGQYSSLDLSICTPTLFLDYSFKVHDDLCGSDHFPVILKNDSSTGMDSDPRKANWDLFQAQCVSKLYPENFKDIGDPIDEFSSLLLQIAEDCIPETSGKARRSRPWFDDDCKTSIRERKAALRKFEITPTSEVTEGLK